MNPETLDEFLKSTCVYDTYTLIITFATLRFGARVGAIAALIVGVGAPLFLHEQALMRTWLALGMSLGAGLVVRRALPERRTSLACFLAITLASERLVLLWGRGARLRVFSQAEQGTWVVYGVPRGEVQ